MSHGWRNRQKGSGDKGDAEKPRKASRFVSQSICHNEPRNTEVEFVLHLLPCCVVFAKMVSLRRLANEQLVLLNRLTLFEQRSASSSTYKQAFAESWKAFWLAATLAFVAVVGRGQTMRVPRQQ